MTHNAEADPGFDQGWGGPAQIVTGLNCRWWVSEYLPNI